MIEIILDSFNSLFRAIDIFLKTKDLTLGAILAALAPFIAVWVKLSREKEKRARSILVERRQLQIAFNVNEIMEALKVESKWSLQEIGSTNAVQKSYKQLLTMSCKATLQKKFNCPRRKKIMERLKSRKLWIAIISAVLLVLKEGLDIQVDTEVVLGFAGIVITAILGLAHVDAVKAKNEVTKDVQYKGDGPAV